MSVRVGWGEETWVEEMWVEEAGASEAVLSAAVAWFGTAELLVTILFALAVAVATLALVLSSA
jgi:hypothetical protein